MHRFYCPALNDEDPIVRIHDKKEIHHCKDVLRLKPGDTIDLFNGKGREATGTIISLTKKEASIEIDSYQVSQGGKITVILACAIPRRAKFETIIEKTTELGIDEIIPLVTHRTEFSVGEDKLQRKNLRYQTVAINAVKQTRRKTIPLIYPITPLKEVLKAIEKNDLALLLCLSGQRKKLKEVLLRNDVKVRRIIYLIGPEGDFTNEEIALAKAAGCIPISLGATILKVDTAAIAVLSFIRLTLFDEE